MHKEGPGKHYIRIQTFQSLFSFSFLLWKGIVLKYLEIHTNVKKSFQNFKLTFTFTFLMQANIFLRWLLQVRRKMNFYSVIIELKWSRFHKCKNFINLLNNFALNRSSSIIGRPIQNYKDLRNLTKGLSSHWKEK